MSDKKILQDLHKENQIFLEKAIITISTSSIPLLLEAISRKYIDFIYPLFVFCLVIILCMISSLLVTKGLDGLMPVKKGAHSKLTIAKWIDCCRNIIFIMAILMLPIITLLNMSKNTDQQTAKEEKIKTKETKAIVPPTKIIPPKPVKKP